MLRAITLIYCLLLSCTSDAQVQRFMGWYKGDHAFFIELDTSGKTGEGSFHGKFTENGRIVYYRCSVRNIKREGNEIRFYPDHRGLRFSYDPNFSKQRKDRLNRFYGSIYDIQGGRIKDGEVWMRMASVFAWSAFDWVLCTPVKARKE